MKRWLIASLMLIVPVVALANWMYLPGPGYSIATVGNIACSGDMTDGGNESFEKGSGQFCTTDWTETDSAGVVDLYSSAHANCGNTSMAIVCDTDTADVNNNRAIIDIGATDGTQTLRFYFWHNGANSPWAAGRIISSSTSTYYATATPGMQWFNNDGTHQFSLRDEDENPTEKFNLAANTKYRIEISLNTSSTSCMKVWDASGNAVQTTNGGGDVDICITNSTTTRYWVFSDQANDATDGTYYIDDVRLELSPSGDVGAQTCN